MAKLKLNSALATLSGSIDGWVYKQYSDKRGLVLSRKPDMTKVKPSAAQLAHRKRMREAAKFHQQVLNDAALLKKFRRIAAQKGINLSAATMGEILRRK
jgi:hypothetical protein